MSRPIAVLRPEPGNAATVARCRTAGLETIALPLFTVVPLDWAAPDATAFDALLLTSANAVRHAGPALAGLSVLPVLAVGAATARAAAAAGLSVTLTGSGDAAALVAKAAAAGTQRALHLGGRDTTVEVAGIVAESISVYASEPDDIDPADLAMLAGSTALLHSARAAVRLGELIDRAGVTRKSISIAAISPAVALAADRGWGALTVAATPNDAALIAAARRLDSPARIRDD